MIASIVLIYLAQGIFSVDLLNTDLAYVQTLVFCVVLASISYFTQQYERNQPLFPLPPKLTSSTYDRRRKIAVATIAVASQCVGSLFRVLDMALGEGSKGYLGDMSR
jgi:hypothetical protein